MIENLKTEKSSLKNISNHKIKNITKRSLVGVWALIHSDISGSDHQFWTILAPIFSILNKISQSTSKVNSTVSVWEYDESYSILTQKYLKVQAKGIIEWLSNDSFKLTTLTKPQSIMIYERRL